MATKLNYTRLTALNPFIFEDFTNSIGQRVQLVEHPIHGDEYEVIVLFPEYSVAFNSTFFECDDMMASHGEYQPWFDGTNLWLGDTMA